MARSRGFKTALAIIIIVAIPLGYLVVRHPYALTTGFLSVRCEEYLCRHCGAELCIKKSSRFGIFHTTSEEVSGTRYSNEFSSDIDHGAHEWVLAFAFSNRWDDSYMEEEGPAGDLWYTAWDRDRIEAIQLFCEKTGRDPVKVWQILAEFSLDREKYPGAAETSEPFGSWLDENYHVITGEPKHEADADVPGDDIDTGPGIAEDNPDNVENIPDDTEDNPDQ